MTLSENRTPLFGIMLGTKLKHVDLDAYKASQGAPAIAGTRHKWIGGSAIFA